MKINRDLLIKASFILGFIISFIGVFFKISHWHGALVLLFIGLAASLIFMAISIYEISKSTKIYKPEKIMWIICIILICNLAGLIYLILGRKRITTASE